MKFDDILTLIKAGYTKEEITALTADNTADIADAPTVEAAQQAATQAETGQQETQVATDLAGMLNKINDTLAALQAAAITGDSRGAAAQKPTAGQSLAKAITMTK